MADSIKVFLCGDVMLGRGIDQILPHPSAPRIYEDYLKDAREYLRLAERESGPIQVPADFAYPWGDALEIWEKQAPELRIINLETSVTRSEDYWKGKGINYRMSPANIRSLTEARIDACALANNHVLDWGYKGLAETLTTLRSAGLKSTGAGENEREADDPAELAVPGKGRVQLLSFGVESSGIPRAWGASTAKPGVNLLPDLSQSTVTRIAKATGPLKAAADCVIISLHWGSNWDFEVTKEERAFAHKLIDDAGADVVYGHSSHHVKGIEIYHDRLILYGCGDFINDYEGIKGFHDFRGDLGLMYFANLDAATGSLKRLTMFPTTVSQFRIQKASHSGARWLSDTLNREGRRFGTGVQLLDDDTIVLQKLQTKETF